MQLTQSIQGLMRFSRLTLTNVRVIIYDMQLTQSIWSISYVKGVSNDIIFTLYISCTINLVNSQIGNHLEYKSRSTYESNNIDWALLNVDTFLIKVEIL